jgi:hypothetical protein
MLMVQRLPDDCLTVALANGGRKHFGWGTDRHLAADLFDALNANTRATGQWKKGSVPDIKPWPRPARPGSEEKKVTSVADLYSRFAPRKA